MVSSSFFRLVCAKSGENIRAGNFPILRAARFVLQWGEECEKTGREANAVHSLGLYLHIPFCKAKCIYCDFYSLPHSEEKMDAYAAALQRDLIRRAPDARDHTVDTVYFGGGTPSYLGADRLCRILETVFAHYHVDKTAEITTEANPDSARDAAALRQLRSAGFNRISLGMQSACDDELRLIGRVHTHRETVEAVSAARAAGFDNLSLDLIYGLPEQTAARWRENLRAAIALQPEHLSCYGLKIEEGTPLFFKKDGLFIPDDDAQAEEYLAAVGLLEEAGYRQYEISNFARPGRASRHNLKYWTMQEYLGFGPGAHSDFGGRRFAYARDLSAYIRGEEHLSESACPAPREREEERVMLALRTTQGLDLSTLGEDTREAEAVLEECARHGLAQRENGRWRLTPQGFLVSNAVIVRVLEALSL